MDIDKLFLKRKNSIPIRVTPRFKDFVDERRRKVVENGGPILSTPEISDQILRELIETKKTLNDHKIKMRFNWF